MSLVVYRGPESRTVTAKSLEENLEGSGRAAPLEGTASRFGVCEDRPKQPRRVLLVSIGVARIQNRELCKSMYQQPGRINTGQPKRTVR